MSAEVKNNWHTLFVTIFQVSADEGIGKYSKLVEIWTRKLFQIYACVISLRKAKHLDATTVFTYSHANTPLGQSECTYCLSYFREHNGTVRNDVRVWERARPSGRDLKTCFVLVAILMICEPLMNLWNLVQSFRSWTLWSVVTFRNRAWQSL